MKAKGSLYEVLKSATRGAGDPAAASPAPAPAAAAEGAAPQTLQDRLAAYKAQKLAAATSLSEPVAEAPRAPAPVEATSTAVAEATPPPQPKPAPVQMPTLVMPPPPAPASTRLVVEPPAVDGPGEKVVRLTYNTLAFAGLVAVGLLFVAYAVGAQSGRRRAALEDPAPSPRPAVAAMPVPPPPPPPPPPPAQKIHTVWLAEWKYGVASERMKADDAVRQLKAALDKAGLKGAQSMKVQRGSEPRLALHIDEIKDLSSPEARARLETLKKFRFGTTTPFAQAAFVELPK
jgi:hypothetical protein